MSESLVTMRQLTPLDAPRLGAFFENNNRSEITSTFHPFPLNTESAVRLLRPESKDTFFGVETEGQLVAFSMLRGMDEGYAIPSFGILVDYRRQDRGWGRRLTAWTLCQAAAAGFEKVRLTVFRRNQRAVHLYQSLGFSEETREPLPDGDERLVMFWDASTIQT